MTFSGEYEKLFYESLRIRLVEERLISLYPSDKIQSPVHLSIGQEAVAVGACSPLKVQDLVFCTYRSHAYYLAKGGDMRQMFAELYGKSTGCCGGKGGSMHLAAPEVGLMGASAVVASTISHAVGAALAAKLLQKDHVCVAVFGDGAMDEGVYHESLNFAALRKVPILFLVENNTLAVHSRVESRHAFSTLEHARAYGIPSARVEEGWDFVKIAAFMEGELAALRKERSPRLLEVQTFRYKEHVGVGDDFEAGYRSREDLLAWQKNDPLVTDSRSREVFSAAIEREIDDAVRFAEESSLPEPCALLRDVI
jgi:TPP-dependent pyruvate/acetoin dehydrogenase alpha subunit